MMKSNHIKETFLAKYNNIHDVHSVEYYELYTTLYPILLNYLQMFGIPTNGLQHLGPLLKSAFDQTSNGLSQQSLKNILDANGGIENTLNTVTRAIKEFIAEGYTATTPMSKYMLEFNNLRNTLYSAYNNAIKFISETSKISNKLNQPLSFLNKTGTDIKSARINNLNTAMMNGRQLSEYPRQLISYIQDLTGVSNKASTTTKATKKYNMGLFKNIDTPSTYENYLLTKNGQTLNIPKSDMLNIPCHEIAPGFFQIDFDESLLDHPLTVGADDNGMYVFDPLALFIMYGFIPFDINEYASDEGFKYTNVDKIQSGRFTRTRLNSTANRIALYGCDSIN